VRLALVLVVLGGCAKDAPSVPGPRFQLACDSADTSQASTLFCVRLDTRNGDAVVLDLEKLPVTTGPSRAIEDVDGAYVMACDSTVTPQHSDFRCLRMHTRTGDVVVLRLSELPHFPR